MARPNAIISLMALSSSRGNYCNFMSRIYPVFAVHTSWQLHKIRLNLIKKKNQHASCTKETQWYQIMPISMQHPQM